MKLKTKTVSRVEVVDGNFSVDDRGVVSFVNDFDFRGVKRCYLVNNFDTKTIRAFHGHKKEMKFVMVIKGSVILNVVKVSRMDKPTKKVVPTRIILSEHKPQVVKIPKGHANGFRALEQNSVVMFFSTLTLEESQKDDYRFPWNFWGEKIWKVENR